MMKEFNVFYGDGPPVVEAGKPMSMLHVESFDTEDEAIEWISKRIDANTAPTFSIYNKDGEITHHLPDIRRLIRERRTQAE